MGFFFSNFFPILCIQKFGEFFRLHTRKTKFSKKIQKFNHHSAKFRKRKNPEIWKMKKKWQSSKGIFSQIWL